MGIWKLLAILQVILVVLLAVVHGNAATATKLKTARKITLTGAVSGNANFDGSGNISIATTQANIAVLTGTIVMPAADSGELTGYVEVSYPKGFSKDNCIVVGLMSHNTMNVGQWSTTMNSQDTLSIMFGNGDLTAILKSNVIRIMSNKTANSTTARNVTYKVALMKIS